MGNSTTITRRVTARVVALATALALGTSVLTSALVPSAATAEESPAQYGTITAPSGYLPRANTCGTYGYSYDITPPPGIWAVEFFITDPRGNAVSSWGALEGYAAGKQGSTTYTLCRNNTAPGTFTIAGKMTTDDGNGNVTTYQMKPAAFTLLDLPKKAKTTKKGKAGKKNRKNRKKSRKPKNRG